MNRFLSYRLAVVFAILAFAIATAPTVSSSFANDLSVQVFPPYQGKLIKALVELGDKVPKGQPLYTIDGPDLIPAESGLIAAAATFEMTIKNWPAPIGMPALQRCFRISVADGGIGRTRPNNKPMWWDSVALILGEERGMVARTLMAVALAGLLTSTLYLLLVGVAALRFRKKRLPCTGGDLPPVTLLKPLYGIEPQLRDSLQSFFRLDYPQFEIIFGARTTDDPALAIVRELMGIYPQVPVNVVTPGEPPWPNAKCWSLMNMVGEARFNHLVISDSDVQVGSDYLRHLIPPLLQPGVGCVTTVFRGKPTGGLWARLEALGMSVEMTSGVLVADMLEGMKFALGPTMAVRREALQKVGGFAAFAEYCSDDFLLGKEIAAAGYKVILSPHVIDHVILHGSLRQSLAHQTRWMRSTRYSRPKGHLGMALTFAMPYGVLGLLAGAASGELLLGSMVFAATFLNRVILSIVAGWTAIDDQRSLAYCWLYPLRDLMGFGFWLASFVSNKILWRGEQYRLEVGGRMVRSMSDLQSLRLGAPRAWAAWRSIAVAVIARGGNLVGHLRPKCKLRLSVMYGVNLQASELPPTCTLWVTNVGRQPVVVSGIALRRRSTNEEYCLFSHKYPKRLEPNDEVVEVFDQPGSLPTDAEALYAYCSTGKEWKLPKKWLKKLLRHQTRESAA